MTNNTWEQVKEFYESKFGIDPELVDVVADLDVLRLCVSGSSNASIAKALSLQEGVIRDTIERYFHFPGFTNNVGFSPIALYNRMGGNYTEFRRATLEYTWQETMSMFDYCVILGDIEAVVNDNWI